MKCIVIYLVGYLMFIAGDSFAQDNQNYQIKTIVIDPGHGGKDPGAVRKNIYEKDINLSVALKLGKYIEENFKNVKVIYTRKTDVFLEVFKRAEIANKNNADLFISIHVNANKKPEAQGSETYVMGLHKTQSNLDVAMLENAAILKEENYQDKYEGFDPKSIEAFIMFTMYQNAHLDHSLIFSSLIQEEFRFLIKRQDRGVKQAGFLVLWKTTMPSVLVELGFLSNEDDALFLVKEENQQKMALALFNAFKNYKSVVEGTSSGNALNTHALVNEEKKINKVDTIKTNPINTKENIIPKTDTTQFQKMAENMLKTAVLDSGIVFKIQITSASKPIPIKKSNFKELENISEILSNGIYKYYYSRFSTYNEASAKLNIVRELYPDAFVVAFNNGKKISVSEAIK